MTPALKFVRRTSERLRRSRSALDSDPTEPARNHRSISKPRRRERNGKTQLIHLPDDVLVQIAKFLDKESLHSFSRTHLRIRSLCRHSALMEAIQSRVLDDFLIQLTPLNAARVRILNLSNCWSNSKSMRDLIRKCRIVTKLNVVNSSLKLIHLRDALESLERLRDLSVSMPESRSATIRLGVYSGVEKLYVEFTPSHKGTEFLVRFLEVCTGVKSLHLNVIGSSNDRCPREFRTLSAERSNSYQTIILSTSMQARWSLRQVVLYVFGRTPHLQEYFGGRFSPDGVYWFERGNPRLEDELAQDSLSRHYQSLDLKRENDPQIQEIPDSYRTGHLGLRIDFNYRGSSFRMPPMNPLSSLVELDLTRCHLVYSAESWRALADSSPCVEALALPACALQLPPPSYFYVASGSELILPALRRLNLKKLYIKGYSRECKECQLAAFPGVCMRYLSDFHNLEELIMEQLHPGNNFFKAVDRPLMMKTLKFQFRHEPQWEHIGKFLRHCKNLRNLKLTYHWLPLQSVEFWDALGAANLKQLCLSANSDQSIDTKTLKPAISRLLKTLNVLHLHGERASREAKVVSLLEGEVEKENLLRKRNPVHFVHMDLPVSGDITELPVPRYPGRNLCSLKTFIATVKPIGWDLN